MDAAISLLPGLSKSRFLTGSKCHRLLWWSVNEPDATELEHDAGSELIFTQGHLVGEEARRRFPGGVLVDLPHDQVEERLARTRELIDAGADVIFEASFRHDGIFVAVDVLERLNDGSWHLIEVKSSTKVKDENLLDVAIQSHVLRGCGLDVNRVSLMHLSRECVYPDLESLFEAVDLTEAAAACERHVAIESQAQRQMLARELPPVDTGDHCTAPRDCPFLVRCHAEMPEHHVTTLYRIGGKAQKLIDAGYTTIFDLPENDDAEQNAEEFVELGAVARRQVSAVKADKIIVEAGLRCVLKSIEGPVAFFDLETVAFAIPRFAGTRPWDAVPAQASIHLETGGHVLHHAFLAGCDADPREALGRFVIERLRGARTVLAWNASFEKRCLQEIGRAFPHLKCKLDDVIARLVDLLPIVRNNVYHPAFGGSFSLKSVAPALVPELSYAGLDVAGGMDASATLFRLFNEPTLPDDERVHLRTDLLAYCALDTEALVDVLTALRRLAKAKAA